MAVKQATWLGFFWVGIIGTVSFGYFLGSRNTDDNSSPETGLASATEEAVPEKPSKPLTQREQNIKEFIKTGKKPESLVGGLAEIDLRHIWFSEDDYEGLVNNWSSFVGHMPGTFFKKFTTKCSFAGGCIVINDVMVWKEKQNLYIPFKFDTNNKPNSIAINAKDSGDEKTIKVDLKGKMHIAECSSKKTKKPQCTIAPTVADDLSKTVDKIHDVYKKTMRRLELLGDTGQGHNGAYHTRGEGMTNKK